MAAAGTTCSNWKPRRLNASELRALVEAARHENRSASLTIVNEQEDPMRPTTADDNVFDFNALLHPGTVFEHPRDVVRHEGLTLSEKRAILASWASDASAIASCPSMRAPAGLKK